MRAFQILGAILLAAGLSACGGGGGGSSSGADNDGGIAETANGFWDGTFTEVGYGTADVSVVAHNGQIFAISEEAGTIYDGTYTISGGSLTGTVVVFEADGGIIGTTSLSGTVSTESSMSLSFTTSYGTTGTASLAFDPLYNTPSSLGMISGIWGYSVGLDSIAITISGDGTFFGQDSDGCTYTGQFVTPNSSKNLYTLEVDVALCGEWNGDYTGLATLLDNNTMQTVVSNENFVFLTPYERQ